MGKQRPRRERLSLWGRRNSFWLRRGLLVAIMVELVSIGVWLRDIFARLSIAAVTVSFVALWKESWGKYVNPLPLLEVEPTGVYVSGTQPGTIFIWISNFGKANASEVQCQWSVCDEKGVSLGDSTGRNIDVTDWIPPGVTREFELKHIPIIDEDFAKRCVVHLRLRSKETGHLKEMKFPLKPLR